MMTPEQITEARKKARPDIDELLKKHEYAIVVSVLGEIEGEMILKAFEGDRLNGDKLAKMLYGKQP